MSKLQVAWFPQRATAYLGGGIYLCVLLKPPALSMVQPQRHQALNTSDKSSQLRRDLSGTDFFGFGEDIHVLNNVKAELRVYLW